MLQWCFFFEKVSSCVRQPWKASGFLFFVFVCIEMCRGGFECIRKASLVAEAFILQLRDAERNELKLTR